MNIVNADKFDIDLDTVKAVFICNTPLHVYNALQAASNWGLDTRQCILVLKLISNNLTLDRSLESFVEWKEVVWIDPFPLPPRIKKKGNRKRIIQYRFFKEWQEKLNQAKGCRYVFLCHNRQQENKVIASFVEAKELVWLEDGTLSYFLWQEERVIPPQVRESRKKKVLPSKKPVAKKPEAKKPVAKKPVAKKPEAKKPVAKKLEAKKLVAKKPVAKKPVAKKPAARRK
ncbi:MAG: hypothetical protein JJT87_14235 [Halomonas sp.]|nr:hypothetical protein [Halomonas sp.]MCC5903068.1 hypothetical protein [Halomonas sp.]